MNFLLEIKLKLFMTIFRFRENYIDNVKFRIQMIETIHNNVR